MSRSTRSVPTVIEHQPSHKRLRFTHGGFVHIRYGLARVAPPVSSDPHAIRMSEMAGRGGEALWPSLWAELVAGRITAFGHVSPMGRTPIDRSVWAGVSPAECPATITVPGGTHAVVPLVRVGELEWFSLWHAKYTVWTADQAVIWICTRNRELVDLASPQRGADRLTWASFAAIGEFPEVLPGDAMMRLQDDFRAGRQIAFMGFKRPSSAAIAKGAWHIAGPSEDPAPYLTLRDADDELHGFVVDPVSMLHLYPATKAQEADADTADVVAPPTNANKTRCRNWLVAEMTASPNKRARTKAWYEAQSLEKFQVGPRPFKDAWKEAVEIAQTPAWSQAGAPKKADRLLD